MDLYPAAFIPPHERHPEWKVVFADMNITAKGTTLSDAFEIAYETLENHLRSLAERRVRRPKASNLNEAVPLFATQVGKAGLTLPGDAIYQYVPTPNLSEPAIRVTMSMTPRTLEAIDRAAERDGLTRSGFVVAACRERITKQLQHR